MRALLRIVGVAGIALAAIYFTVPADRLPLPDALGHDATLHTMHVKHAIVALVVGLVCLFASWRRSPA
jgi:hypothetical protein